MNIRCRSGVALRPSIKRMAAGIEPVCGMFFCLFLFVLIMVQMELFRYHTSALYLEDALAASGLAAAVVDLEEYGISDEIRIRDREECYRRYEQALRSNLGLNEQWQSEREQWITGNVQIEQFIIYTVGAGGSYSESRDAQGQWSLQQSLGEEIYAPNGRLIQQTGIYGQVSYDVKGLWGITLRARKGVLVDVMSGKVKGERNEINKETE